MVAQRLWLKVFLLPPGNTDVDWRREKSRSRSSGDD
jgi:hypothetical protein